MVQPWSIWADVTESMVFVFFSSSPQTLGQGPSQGIQYMLWKRESRPKTTQLSLSSLHKKDRKVRRLFVCDYNGISWGNSSEASKWSHRISSTGLAIQAATTRREHIPRRRRRNACCLFLDKIHDPCKKHVGIIGSWMGSQLVHVGETDSQKGILGLWKNGAAIWWDPGLHTRGGWENWRRQGRDSSARFPTSGCIKSREGFQQARGTLQAHSFLAQAQVRLYLIVLCRNL